MNRTAFVEFLAQAALGNPDERGSGMNIYEKLARCSSGDEVRRMLAGNDKMVVPMQMTDAMMATAEGTLDDWTDSSYGSDAHGNRYDYTHLMSGWQQAVWRTVLSAVKTK